MRKIIYCMKSPEYMNVAGIIIAGGESRRMNNDMPKPFILLRGKPLIWYSFQLLDQLHVSQRFVSISKKSSEYFIKGILKLDSTATCILDVDDSKKGNATGLISVMAHLPEYIKHVLVLHPDSSCFVSKQTLNPALKKHINNHLIASFSVKEKDFLKSRKSKKNQDFEPTSAGAFIFEKEWLIGALDALKIDLGKNEHRIEYLFEQANEQNGNLVSLFSIPDDEYLNINTLDDIKRAEFYFRKDN